MITTRFFFTEIPHRLPTDWFVPSREIWEFLFFSFRIGKCRLFCYGSAVITKWGFCKWDRQEIDELAFRPNVFKIGRLFRLVSRGQLALNSANSICLPKTIQSKSGLSKLYLSTPCFALDLLDQFSFFWLGTRKSTGGIPAKCIQMMNVCKWTNLSNRVRRYIVRTEEMTKSFNHRTPV